jgi:hypothetical protein
MVAGRRNHSFFAFNQFRKPCNHPNLVTIVLRRASSRNQKRGLSSERSWGTVFTLKLQNVRTPEVSANARVI